MASFGLQDRDEDSEAPEATDGNGEATESQGQGLEGIAVAVAVLVQQSRSTIDSFWRRQIAATVSHDGCRDHFGMDCGDLLFEYVNAIIRWRKNKKIRK